MNTHRLFARFRWLNLSAGVLVALLQRTPVLRVLISSEAIWSAPSAAVLRSILLPAAALGSVHSLAGATVLSSTQPSPLSVPVGTPIKQVGFTVTNTINIGSWKVTGAIPPGLTLSAVEGGDILTGPGMLDATMAGISDSYGVTTGGNSKTTPFLSGTPTTPGSYTFNLQSFEFGGLNGLASDTFSFSVTVTGTALGFTTQPQSQTITAGQSVTFTSAASSTATYQWAKNGVAISGATGANLTLTNVQSSDAGSYTVTASNSAGAITNAAVTLTVNPGSAGFAFTVQPVSQTIAPGGSATFTATAPGATSYQWQKNGTAISTATGNTFTLNNLTSANSGTYAVVATNGSGSTTSSGAVLLVATPNAGRLIGLSVRTTAGAGSQTLIVGFAVSGSGNKPLLIRASGPALTQFGVPGVLSDPKLELHTTLNNQDTIMSANDNWGGTTTLSSAFSQMGAFAWPVNSLDAALLVSPGSGAYTAQVSGVGGATGVALVEVYDASLPTDINPPRLTAISARSQVGTDANILIAGFSISGNVPKKLLIRGVGPTLGNFGVGGVLNDPKLEIHTTVNGQDTIIATNDNWGDAPNDSSQQATAFSSVGAFALIAGSKDAAIVATLVPGTYSAQVIGVGNTTGVAIVEVYELP
ncbi:MAG TPA: immunoglobulin domain-containing protein [Opitutaceae bacterium]|nr:immunoglobulin domain-containing protein [Opitutaceae bacterium]